MPVSAIAIAARVQRPSGYRVAITCTAAARKKATLPAAKALVRYIEAERHDDRHVRPDQPDEESCCVFTKLDNLRK